MKVTKMADDGMELERLLRPDIATMEEYTPIAPYEVLSRQLGIPEDRIVKLDANENPYGPAPEVYESLAACKHYNIYPDPAQTLLREAIEPYLGISKEYVIFGNGSDEIIDLVMRLFIAPGDVVINLPPTFGMYSYNASLCAATVRNVPRRDGFELDVQNIERSVQVDGARVKLLIINSPNNPDGSTVSDFELERLLRLPVIVVLDEAYAEFSGHSYVGWVPRHWNLIVLRTFSKWAGLGGLRIGYGVFPPAIATQLWKIKPPYSVNVAAQEAALASLRCRDYLFANVQRIIEERERLASLLQGLGAFQVYPSQANFVLCRVLRGDSRGLKDYLASQGILVRYYDKPGLQDCIRVSVGKPEHTDRLLSALSTYFARLD